MQDVFDIVGSTVAGVFEVERVVAEGGFAVVYRAHHTGFRAKVALKCLKIPEQMSPAHREEFLDQFRAEAELLFRLSGMLPTVVRPLHIDVVTAPNGRFMPLLALEWLEGEALSAIIARRGERRLELPELIELMEPVAFALERAHQLPGPAGPVSIIHRDLKPDNVFVANVAGERVVKILDFGIGKAKSVASQIAGRESQMPSGFAAFTPAYAAPEQWLPKRFGQTGPWTDVWGFALTLVEALKGRPPIEGDQAAMMGTALDSVRRPTPRSEGVDVDPAVEAVFQRALAVDPRERYHAVLEFWNDLRAALDLRPRELPSSGTPVSASPSLAPTRRESPSLAPTEVSSRPPTVSGYAPLRTGLTPYGTPVSAAFGGGSSPPEARLSEVPRSRSTWTRLAPALGLVALSLSLTLADQLYAAQRGAVLGVGPVRLTWIAGVMLVLSVGVGTYLMAKHD